MIRLDPKVHVLRQPPESHSRISELDGFRAVAVLMVLACHMLEGWPLPASATAWMPRIIYSGISHGWLGVDIFFVLSGFLITGILLDDRAKPHYFRNFYARRALRILPLALLCIGIWYLAYGTRYAPFFALALMLSANMSFLFGLPVPHGPGVMWSLAVEEHFYLIWPLGVRIASRRMLVIVAGAIVLLCPIFRAWGVASGMRADGPVYVLSWFRFDGLALGALLAIFVRSVYFTARNTWIGVALVIALMCAVTKAAVPFGVFQVGAPAAAALRSPQALVLCASAMALTLAHPHSPWTSVLRSRFARWTAKLSYCLYMVHLAVGDFYYWLLAQIGISDVVRFGGPGALAVRSVAIVGASYAIAVCSHRYLESPFMRLRRYVARE